MLPATEERVPAHTATSVNAEILRGMMGRIEACVGQPDRIADQLARLRREWDVERTLEANAASVSLLGLALGAFVTPWFFLLPAIVAAFLLQHALQGWCPPLPILRRLGFRTAREIEIERVSLKAMRGDFQNVGTSATAAVRSAEQ
jgi:hypothetical protein